LGSDIYVYGGGDNRGAQHASVFKYDTVADVWTTLAPMSTFGVYHGVATLDGQIYLMGVGNSGKTALLFNPASGVWVNLAPTLRNRQKGSLFVLDGCVHAAGGNGNDTSVERYDAGTDTWTAAANMLEGRMLSGAVTIPAAGSAEEQNLFDTLIAKATR
jgi:N-acetylneuraminic acid mutarotase